MTENLTSSERNWAAIAHGSAILTLIIAGITGSAAVWLGLLVPLAIYLGYYKRSEYIAFHALQALTFQAAAIVLAFVGLFVGGIIIATAWIITAVLSLVIVGLLLIPVSLGITVIFAVLTLVYPFALVLYAVIGSYKSYSGEEFEYAYIGNLVRGQINWPTPEGDKSSLTHVRS